MKLEIIVSSYYFFSISFSVYENELIVKQWALYLNYSFDVLELKTGWISELDSMHTLLFHFYSHYFLTMRIDQC